MKRSLKYALMLGAAGVGGFLAYRRTSNYSFRNRIVVIAGGSRGLALALARRLVEEGAWVALLARSEDELERAQADLERRGGIARTYVCDVTNRESVTEAITQVADDFGRIDVLVNNAGVIVSAPFDNHLDSDFELAVKTHLFGPIYATRAALPFMRRQGGGRILNISSIGGKVGVPHMTAYSASKHGLVGFSHALAAELRREGIRVTVACPGLMRTGSHRAAGFRGRHAEEFAWFAAASATPLLGISADGAAVRLIDAVRSGKAEIMFPWHWRLAAIGSGAVPGLTVGANAIFNRWLPRPTSLPGRKALGREARGDSPPEWYTRSLEQAASELNQS